MPRPQLLLCYHKVGPVSEEGRWLNVEPLRLHAHVAYFFRRGWRFQTASEAVRREIGTVGFQFDDAYDSAVRHAPSVFSDFGARATFWAVPSLVGERSVWDGDQAGVLAGWDELRSLRTIGHEIGNHTHSHQRLSSLDHSAQRRQILQAKVDLESRGFSGETLCFPYGDHNSKTLDVMRELGLSAGFALAKRPANASDDSLALPRIVVAYSDSIAGLLYKIYVRPRLP